MTTRSGARAAMTVLVFVAFLGAENSVAVEGSGGNGYLEMSRGLGIDSAFATESIDNVNLFNGNLVLNVPLGEPIQAGRITYGFNAVYNSRNWDFVVRCVVGGTSCWDWAIPAVTSNAGNGWIVTLGQLYEPWKEVRDAPSWPNLSDSDFVYVAPDGSSTVLACEPTASHGCGAVWYSSSLGMRLRRTSSSQMLLDFPDGSIHRFERKTWAGCPLSNVYDTCWLLTQISDTYGNAVNLSYHKFSDIGPHIIVSDSFNRSHRIQYKSSPSDKTAQGAYQYVIDYVTVNGQTYTFSYDNEEIDREFPHRAPGEPIEPEVWVPLLEQISGPLSQNYAFGYVTTGDRNSGALDYYKVPTGGEVQFRYDDWEFPKACDVNLFATGTGGIPHFDNYQRSQLRGVVSRSVTDPWGPDGTTTYSGVAEDRWSGNPGEGGCTRPRWFKTEVHYPATSAGLRRKEVHWYSVATRDEGNWKRAEYGLPIHKDRYLDTSAAGRVYRSVEIHQCSVNGGCTQLSDIYRRYATRFVSSGDFCEIGDSPACSRRDSVLVAEHQTFPSDPGTYRGTRWRDYDGLGNFGEVAEYSGGFPGSNGWRYTLQDFNGGLSGHVTQNDDSIVVGPGFFNALPGTGSRYTLNLYSKIETYDDSFGQRTDFCFNTAGDVIGMRRRVSRNSTSDALGTFYARNGSGQVTAEHHGIGHSNTCGTPSNAAVLNHTYDGSGNRVNSRYSGHTEYEMKREFNSAGYVINEWAPNGVQTSYSRDSLGRPTQITVGATTATTLSYSNASSTRRANVVAARGNLSVTLEADGFGRPVSESRSLPGLGARTLSTSIAYDAAGNTTSVQQGSARRAWSFDSLGRVLQATGVDGTTTDYSYTGERIRQEESSETTTTYLDADGRPAEVELGKAFPSGAPTACIAYQHDPEGRVRLERRFAGYCHSGLQQAKRHEYDGRGFLTEQATPEVGAVQYGSFDPFGNPGSISRLGSTLSISYNTRGRTTSISGGGQTLAEFEYGQSSCSAGSHCAGQVTLARRRNMLGGAEYLVETRPVYNGPRGEVTSRRVSVEYPRGGAGTPGTQEFVIGSAFDAAGRLSMLGYPSCADCATDPDRAVAYQYEDDMLTGLTESSDDINADFLYNSTGVLDFIGYHGFSTAYTEIGRRNGSRVDRIKAEAGGQVLWDSGQYRYDSAGRITDIGGDSYRYDNLGRVTESSITLHDRRSATAKSTYDAFDNLESISTTIAGATTLERFSPSSSTNRLTDSGYSYDTDGNLEADACRTYEFDALGMLTTTAAKPDAPAGCPPGGTYQYLYDAGNQRVLAVCDDCSAVTLDVNLRIEPAAVAPGGSVTLSWDRVEGAERCDAFDGLVGWSGRKDITGGSQTLPIAGDTSFGLRCTAGELTVEDIAFADVFAPAFELTGPAEAVAIGTEVDLEWTAVAYADTCEASGGWEGTKATAPGKETVTIDRPTTFTLTCVGGGGSTSHSVFVDVIFPAPAFTATLDGQSGNGFYLPGETFVIEWSAVTNADGCSLSHSGQPIVFNPSGPISLEGGTAVSEPLGDASAFFERVSTVYVRCWNEYKSHVRTFTIYLGETQPVFSFSAYPNKRTDGVNPRLRWSRVWRANNCWPSGGGWSPGDIVPSLEGGEFEVHPHIDTSYSMKCRGPFGETEHSVTVLGTVDVIWLPSRVAEQLAGTVSTTPLAVTLTWDYDGAGHDGFRVLRRPPGTSRWHLAGTPAADARSFVDTNVSYSREYEYAVRAYAGSEAGDIGNLLRVTTPPAPRQPYWLVSKDCLPENGCPAVSGGETFEYPTVLQGAHTTHAKFVIDSQSASDHLDIDLDLHSADWRVVRAPTVRVPPTGRTFVEFAIDTAAPGRRVTDVTIRTNDPARPTMTFTLARNVVAEAGKLVIVEQPQYSEVLAGTRASVSVVVDGGSGDYGYEWLDTLPDGCIFWPCDTPIAHDDPRYEGADTDTLTVRNVEHARSYGFRVRVWDKQNPDTVNEIYSSEGGFDAIGVDLQAAGPSLIVTEGDAATFVVRADGYGDLSYRWRGPDGELVDDWNYAGTASPTLTIRNANPEIAGDYSVRVSNGLDHWTDTRFADLSLTVVPRDVELAHAFGTGESADSLWSLNGNPLNVGDAAWAASPTIKSNPRFLTNQPVDGVARATVPLPHSIRDALVEVMVDLGRVASGDSGAQFEFGVGRFTSPDDAAFTGLSVRMNKGGALQIIRNGTEVLATGTSEDCPWRGCVATLSLDTVRGTAEVRVERRDGGTFTAASAAGLRGFDDVDSAFLGFMNQADAYGYYGWFEAKRMIVDIDRRPNILPMLYLLQ